jgi:glutamate synthase domain-containing protein 3
MMGFAALYPSYRPNNRIIISGRHGLLYIYGIAGNRCCPNNRGTWPWQQIKGGFCGNFSFS